MLCCDGIAVHCTAVLTSAQFLTDSKKLPARPTGVRHGKDYNQVLKTNRWAVHCER